MKPPSFRLQAGGYQGVRTPVVPFNSPEAELSIGSESGEAWRELPQVIYRQVGVPVEREMSDVRHFGVG